MRRRNETILIKGVFYNSIFIPFIGIVIAILSLIYSLHWGAMSNLSVSEMIEYDYFTPFWIGIVVAIVMIIIYLWIGRCSIIVTNKRVHGTSTFGKQVDLPLDLISAVGRQSLFSTIAVSTSSGAIKFMLVKNSDEVFETISDLLQDRQDGKEHSTQNIPKMENSQSGADEIRKYKDLYDNGIISKEEFDAKKKQLLGL